MLTDCFERQKAIANYVEIPFTGLMQRNFSDEQLMIQYAEGDLVAFERLYARHKGGLFRFCFRQLGDQGRAEECFQDIWVKLINARSRYQPTAQFNTYLYRIAQNCVIDSVRRGKKWKNQVSLEHGEIAAVEASEINKEKDSATQLDDARNFQRLRCQITNLPAPQRTALLLKLDAGMSLQQIAEVTGCGRETVKSQLRYATNRLKNYLEDAHD